MFYRMNRNQTYKSPYASEPKHIDGKYLWLLFGSLFFLGFAFNYLQFK
jgi:hypothetical protein